MEESKAAAIKNVYDTVEYLTCDRSEYSINYLQHMVEHLQFLLNKEGYLERIEENDIDITLDNLLECCRLLSVSLNNIVRHTKRVERMCIESDTDAEKCKEN